MSGPSADEPVRPNIVAFLRARLDEDEAWALAASTQREHRGGEVVTTGVHWRWGVGENWDPVELDPALDEYIDEGGTATLLTVEQWPSRSIPNWEFPAYNVRCEEVPTAVGAHIARHDPARVLREVEAKRRIVDECEASPLQVDGYGPLGFVLRYFAAIHDQHPDYDPAWRPS